MNILGTAFVLVQRGYAVHWVRPRSKAPIAEGWSTAPVASLTELRHSYRPGYNLGVRCGHWSRPAPGCGLVVLDLDIRTGEAMQDALATVETLAGAGTYPVVLSGSGNGSRHLWFVCPIEQLPPRANVTILAAEGWKLEVLSTGKQVVVPPSIHPSGQPYRWLMPLTETLPLLPETVHQALAAALEAKAHPAIARTQRRERPSASAGGRPGDDYNQRADWASTLMPHGWILVRQRGEITDWRRPGKDDGISATTNYAGSGLLYIFSTNAVPFESETAYTPFAAFALLEHGGNFSAAAQALSMHGYGKGRATDWHTRARRWVGMLRTVAAEEASRWQR